MDLRSLVNSARNDGAITSSSYIPFLQMKKIRLIKIHLVPILNKRSRMFIFYFNEIADIDIQQFNININTENNSSDTMLELELYPC